MKRLVAMSAVAVAIAGCGGSSQNAAKCAKWKTDAQAVQRLSNNVISAKAIYEKAAAKHGISCPSL